MALPNLKEILNELASKWKKHDEARKSKARIDDLFERFHFYSPTIKVPIPNLYADTLIKQKFGDEIDFNNTEQVMEILWLLNNQEDTELIGLSPEETKKQVNSYMMTIPANAKDDYKKALIEMFVALKKNSIQGKMEILLQAQQVLASLSAK